MLNPPRKTRPERWRTRPTSSSDSSSTSRLFAVVQNSFGLANRTTLRNFYDPEFTPFIVNGAPRQTVDVAGRSQVTIATWFAFEKVAASFAHQYQATGIDCGQTRTTSYRSSCGRRWPTHFSPNQGCRTHDAFGTVEEVQDSATRGLWTNSNVSTWDLGITPAQK